MVTVRSMAWSGIDPQTAPYGVCLVAKETLERGGLSAGNRDL